MAWDARGFYYRSKREGRRVVRQYLGTGPTAQAAAEVDEAIRTRRLAEREQERAVQAAARALEAKVEAVCGLADLVARAALLLAGFRQHQRGVWRRKR